MRDYACNRWEPPTDLHPLSALGEIGERPERM